MTDEGRDVVVPSLTFTSIHSRLRSRGAVLHVLSRIQFEAQTHDGKFITDDVLGANHLGKALVGNYLTGRYHVRHRGYALAESGVGTTYAEYVQLAYVLQGSAFDIRMLRKGLNNNALTKALVNISAEGIEDQFISRCEELSCNNGRLSVEELKELAVRDLCVSG